MIRETTGWFRHIGVNHGSDYIHWQKHPRYVELRKETMGPDFIGHLCATTDDGKPPNTYGTNVCHKAFVFY